MLDVRFELLDDVPREWKADQRVRFHLGASEIIGRLVLFADAPLHAGRERAGAAAAREAPRWPRAAIGS